MTRAMVAKRIVEMAHRHDISQVEQYVTMLGAPAKQSAVQLNITRASVISA
jgi:hypothetical protein